MPNITTSEFISVLSMLIALAASVISPICAFKIAKRQIVSPIRQKWIDELRELFSQYLSECQQVMLMYEGNGLLESNKIDEALLKNLNYLELKIRLMLNSKECEHIALIEYLDEISDETKHGIKDLIKFGEKVELATKLSQKILKSEWNRVKSGEV